MNEQIFNQVVSDLEDYALILLNAEGRIVSWNRGAETIKGYKEHEVKGKNFDIFYTEEDREAGLPQKLMEEARISGRSQTEGWRLDKYHDKFWSKVILTSVEGSNGEVIGYMKITRDLSERLAAEKTIQDYELDLREMTQKSQRLRSMYYAFVSEIKDYAVIMLDENGIVLDWNKGAEKIKGYTYEEIVGNHFSAFYQEDDRKNTLPERLLLAATRDGRVEHEGWRVRKDGGKFWGNVTITAIYNEQGKVRNFIKVTKDHTERQAQENALKQRILELEKQLELLAQ